MRVLRFRPTSARQKAFKKQWFSRLKRSFCSLSAFSLLLFGPWDHVSGPVGLDTCQSLLALQWRCAPFFLSLDANRFQDLLVTLMLQTDGDQGVECFSKDQVPPPYQLYTDKGGLGGPLKA